MADEADQEGVLKLCKQPRYYLSTISPADPIPSSIAGRAFVNDYVLKIPSLSLGARSGTVIAKHKLDSYPFARAAQIVLAQALPFVHNTAEPPPRETIYPRSENNSNGFHRFRMSVLALGTKVPLRWNLRGPRIIRNGGHKRGRRPHI